MAIKANIVIDQGSAFETTIDITDEDGNVINITGYTAAAQMRRHYSSVSYYSFTTAVSGSTGQVTLSMTANTTTGISAGRYVYDCELTDAANVTSRIIEGIVTVTPNVTR